MRTFAGAFLNTGASVFILVHWNSNFYSGVSAAAINFTYMFAPSLFGRLSDRIGRKKSLIVAMAGNSTLGFLYFTIVIFVSGSSSPALAFLYIILVLRLCEGILNGFFWPVLEASVSDVALARSTTLAEYEGETRSGIKSFNIGWNGGSLGGMISFSLVLLALAGNLGPNVALCIPLVVHTINLLTIFFAFKQPYTTAGDKERLLGSVQENDGNSRASRSSAATLGIAGVSLALTFSFLYGFAVNGVALTNTNKLKAIGLSVLIGFSEATRYVGQGLAMWKIRLGNRHLAIKIMAIVGCVACAITVLAFSTLHINIPVFLAIYFLMGILYGIVYVEAINLTVMSGSGRNRGLLMGLFESSNGTGSFVGPLVAGYVTKVSTYISSYFVNSGILGVGLVACAAIVVGSRFRSRSTRRSSSLPSA